MGLSQSQQYYMTRSGTLGYDTDGNPVGQGNGANVYASDRGYYFQLIADAAAQTFELQVYGKGADTPVSSPDAWPTQNMFDQAQWHSVGTVDVQDLFTFSNVYFYNVLRITDRQGYQESSTMSWSCLNVGTPLGFDQIPVTSAASTSSVVPVPGAILLAGLGSCMVGCLRRRRVL